MNKRIINVLNGEYMYDYFKENKVLGEDVILPFNEAMCVGLVTEDLFSNDFIEERCKAHNVSVENYKKHTIDNMKPLLNLDFDEVILWFDDDMFCQINLLTILAYLDKAEYKGKIIFNLVNNNYEIIESFNINREKYYKVYNDVMIRKLCTENVELYTLRNGIKLYLELSKENNEIVEYIKEHENCTIQDLMKKFTNYGLGDTQYMDIIKKTLV